jgi:hypothetical protein
MIERNPGNYICSNCGNEGLNFFHIPSEEEVQTYGSEGETTRHQDTRVGSKALLRHCCVVLWTFALQIL